MTTGAIIFMALSWSLVLSLTFWAYRKMLSIDPKAKLEVAAEEVQAESAQES